MFEAEGDQFRESIAADRQRRLDEFNDDRGVDGQPDVRVDARRARPLRPATLESGAIVAVNVNETDTVTPTNADAVIKLENNPTVKTLAGAEQSVDRLLHDVHRPDLLLRPGPGLERRRSVCSATPPTSSTRR